MVRAARQGQVTRVVVRTGVVRLPTMKVNTQGLPKNGSFLQVFNGKTKSFDWDTLYFHYPRDIPLKTNNLDHNAIVLIG